MVDTFRSRSSVGMVAVLMALAMLAAACGDSDGGSTSETTAAAGTTAATEAAPDTSESASPPDTSESATPATDEVAAPDTTEPAEPAEPSVYDDFEVWMCHPDQPVEDDLCRGENLDTTLVAADGSLTVVPFERDPAPEIDCMFLYPTASDDVTFIADWIPGAEQSSVRGQGARLSEVCDVFAPLYRSVTIAGLFGLNEDEPELSREEAGEQAAGDVREAFMRMVERSDDRGFVLLGHSQGAGMHRRLMQEVIDEDPALRERLVGAYILGSSVTVPRGEVVGGDFENIPLCTSADEAGCIVSYATYRDTVPPTTEGEEGIFGDGDADNQSACVDPAALLGEDIEPYFQVADNFPTHADPATAPTIETVWFGIPDLVSAQCVENDFYNYMELTVNADPADARVDEIAGDFQAGWGMHTIDVNLQAGNINNLIARQAAAR